MKATIVLSLVLAFALGAFGPALDTPKPTPERNRFNVATELMCGSENAAAIEVSPGVVQCFTKRGARTIKSRSLP